MKSLKTKDTLCYNIKLETHPGPVSEYNMTYILETEGGCDIIENNVIIDESGQEVIYPGNCGEEDSIYWDVSGNVIVDQKLILIKYDEGSKRIVVKG